jgi:RimJ/RimL family protein N-acetyltransferase
MYSIEIVTKDGRTLLIREAWGRDARAVLAYLDLISQETDFLSFGPGEFNLTQKEEFDYLEKCLGAENCLYLIALLEETVIGTLSFEAGTRPRIQHAGEFGISVLRKYWGIGVASSLIDSLLEWSIDGNIIRKINLRVRADNNRAITLYKLKGFVVEGTLKNEIFTNDTYYDNLWMGLEI